MLDLRSAPATESTVTTESRSAMQGRSFIVSSSCLLAVVALLLGATLRRTGGVLVYALDDAYIHLAVARNLALHGTYGVTSDTYESASSAPGWTLVLAGLRYAVPAVAHWFPFFLNLGAAIWILHRFAASERLLSWTSAPRLSWAIAALLPLALFLPALVMTGMEHTLHAAITLETLILLSGLADGMLSGRQRLAYYVLIATAPLVRYEAMFVALGCAAGLLLVWRPGCAVWTLLAAALPILGVGVVNRLHGQYFFPNSIVEKSALRFGGPTLWLPTPAKFLGALRQDTMLMVVVLFMVASLGFAAYTRRRGHAAASVAFLVCTVLHLGFAAVGWFDRYQAYLLIAGTFLVLLTAAELTEPQSQRTVLLVLLLILVVLPWRKFQLTYQAPVASSNIYEQHYQMGRFLAQYYNGRAVAINDLGLVSFMHEGPLLDLWGLGSHDILRARAAGRVDQAYMRQVVRSRGVVAIAVYDFWFPRLIPDDWVKVATWTLTGELVTAAWPVVSFYAPSGPAVAELDRNLRAFAPNLPSGVTVHYFR